MMTSFRLLVMSLLTSLVYSSPCPSCFEKQKDDFPAIFPSITAAEEAAVRMLDKNTGEKEVDRLFDTQQENEETNTNRVGSRHKRAVTTLERRYWTKAIVPYVFEDDYDEEKKKEALIAMKQHEKYTCVRFVPWQLLMTSLSFGLPDESHMRFVKGEGCWTTYVGNKHSRRGQAISCCNRKPCIHELSHILGVFHEQVSANRHGWVSINWNNIAQSDWGIYEEQDNIYDYRYDLTSIMHYDSQGFRAGPWPSMSVLFKDMAPLMDIGGNTFYLWQDIAETNQCKERHCPDFTLECINDGYVSYVDSQCRCLCPPGLDYRTGCSTVIKEVEPTKTWPDGPYSLFSASGVCPNGLSPLEFITETRIVDESETFHMGGNITDEVVDPLLCVGETNVRDDTWQPGVYCILAYRGVEACPPDFERHNIAVPEINITICCRDDGYTDEPLTLPYETPFILLPHLINGPCQSVSGMIGTLEVMDLAIEITRVTSPSTLPVRIFGRRQISIGFCYYTKYLGGCGGEIFLSSNKLTDVFTSPGYPGNYTAPVDCYWLVKGPQSSTILLDFDEFNVGGGTNTCRGDFVEIRYGLLGQIAQKQCGRTLDRSFRSVENAMTVRFHSDLIENYRGFRATVKVILPENHCYNVADNGKSYRGKVNFTRDFQPCLPWDQVTSCPFHMFAPNPLEVTLEENYCRNPDNSFRPWCYTKTYEGQCERNYCDVCRLEKVYDVAPDCQELKNRGFCDGNTTEVLASCAKTCNVVPPKTDETSSCGKPPPIHDALMNFDRPWYAVGETVTHKCPYGPDFITRRCHSDGTWSPGNYVCGGCPNGWIPFNRACYKYSPEMLSYKRARDFCALHNSFLSPANSEEELNFIGSMRPKKTNRIWLGTTRIIGEDWINTDDTKLKKYGEWAKQSKDFSKKDVICASIASERSGRSFREEDCNSKYAFVCKRVPTPRRGCVNRRWDCQAMLKRNPNVCENYPEFAWLQCPFSCGICQPYTTPYCKVPLPGANVIASNNVVKFVPRGHVIKYSCDPKTIHMAGNLERTCEDTGWLSGSKPTCTEIENVESPNNDVNLIERLKITETERSFVGNNSLQRIHRDGEVAQWSFYASKDGTAYLQIWRPRPDLGPLKFQFIGQNAIPAVGGRVNIVKVPIYDRIQVHSGDVIGVYSGKEDSPIKHNACGSRVIEEASNNVILDMAWAGFFVTSEVYTFSDPQCRVFSVTAFINTTRHQFTRTSAVPILPGTQKLHIGGNLTYVLSDTFMKIPVDGQLVQWRMYLQTPGEVVLQIWRPKPSEGDLAFELVGQTRIETWRIGRVDISLAKADRINVRKDDVIGIWLGDPPAIIWLQSCRSKDIPDLGPMYFLKSGFNFTEGKVTYFANKLSSCRSYPLVAIIEYVA